MFTLETTTHIGSDGILRLETPVAIKDQDVRVVLVVQAEPSLKAADAKGPAGGASREEKLRAAPIVSPPKGPWNAKPVEALALEIPGPSISETLVNERR